MELLSNVLVFALCYAGLSALCLAMDRHYADLHGRGAEPPAPLRRRLRWTGWLALAAGLALPLLALFEYQPGTESADGLLALSLVYALLPLAFKLLASVLLWRWRNVLDSLEVRS